MESWVAAVIRFNAPKLHLYLQQMEECRCCALFGVRGDSKEEILSLSIHTSADCLTKRETAGASVVWSDIPGVYRDWHLARRYRLLLEQNAFSSLREKKWWSFHIEGLERSDIRQVWPHSDLAVLVLLWLDYLFKMYVLDMSFWIASLSFNPDCLLHPSGSKL